jgi:ubiquinone/menaquinone biosynthesis C-methylase UbiE
MSFPEVFERALVGPLFRPFAESLVDDLELTAGDRVLDIACGTGIVARLAKERVGDSGKVVGVDVNAGMIGVARSIAPGIEWREGDAGALPLDDNEQFDVVCCQQGLQFFPDKPAAVREMRRALAQNGRVAASTWRPEEESPVLLALRKIAEQHVGPIVDRRHSFGDAGALVTLLEENGFHDVRSKTVTCTIRFDDGPLFVRLNGMALVGMSARARELSEQERESAVTAIVRDSADMVKRHTGAEGFSYVIGTNVATARAS